MKTFLIPLTQGKATVMDEETFEAFGKLKWCYSGDGYAVRQERLPDGAKKTVLLHRLVARAQEADHVHHVDRDTLNNLPENLVRLTQSDHARLHILRAPPSRTHPEKVARGERNGKAKLTEMQVRDIRARNQAGESQRQLAQEFGVDPPAVWKIVNGKLWKHLLEEEKA